MEKKTSRIKNMFASMSNNCIVNEKISYIKSGRSNFKKDFKNMASDSAAVSNDLKNTIKKNKEYLYG